MGEKIRRAPYDVIAIRYATFTAMRRDLYFGYPAYGEPDGPIQMDYYFWLLRSRERTILVDVGFDQAVGRRRGRIVLIEPVEALRMLGVDPNHVDLIIVSHMHYDHIGNLARFPKANIVMARSEFEFWTGPLATRRHFADVVESHEIRYVQDAKETDRLSLIDTDHEIVPGVDVRIVGGHCPGQLIVLVDADGGPVVLASDTLHFYEEMERDIPFHILYHLGDMYSAYDLLRILETRDMAVIVAGHDPRVMSRFHPLPGQLGVKIASME